MYINEGICVTQEQKIELEHDDLPLLNILEWTKNKHADVVVIFEVQQKIVQNTWL